MMEMVLQQSSAAAGVVGGGGMIVPSGGVAACRPGTRPRQAATAPMMAKQEREMADDDEQAAEERRQQAGAEEEEELRRGPWTVDEDLSLINYIAQHGEGRWNALARAAGLKRTGKSCRLRWLNYLRPDVKRGDFTADEQLLILDLHSRWGNRWSKIAAQMPGRTDNEIKNYWRTRVQKHAKQLNCDVNSTRFKDAMRFLWMPRLAEQRAAAVAHQQQPPPSSTPTMAAMAAAASDSSCSPAPSSAAAATTAATSSSSSSSLTSSVDTAHHAAAALPTTAVTDDDYWGAGAATTVHQHQQQQQKDQHYDFWSTASALQHLTAAADQTHLVADQDLTGWVQGFSDDCGILSSGSSPAADTLWSLEDVIWRMP